MSNSKESKPNDKEIETALKVLKFLHQERELLTESKYSSILETGKTLFQPRRQLNVIYNISSRDEKVIIRKQRKMEAKLQKQTQYDEKMKNCGMKQKKEREKRDYYSYLQTLPPKGMLEDKKPEMVVVSESEDDIDEIAPSETYVDKRKITCYTCGRAFVELHHFYDRLCPDCAELNWTKREQLVDLKGKVSIVTGGRVKIGYEIGLILLRCGSNVVVTSRFPKDTALRYSKEKDFVDFKDRLHVYGLDMRHIPSVVQFTDFIHSNYDRLDILINNAAQTIRRPPVFYKHLMETEEKPLIAFDEDIRTLLPTGFQMGQESVNMIESSKTSTQLTKITDMSVSAQLSQIPSIEEDLQYNPKHFPEGAVDVNGQQIDLRENNSWNFELCDVPLIEFLEVQAINATAPFILTSRLRSLMAKNKDENKYIINVSAMEGQFYRLRKTTKHPHTNMQKAAVNMMTRTCGEDFAKDKIYMNSVDTGWVTDERARGFETTFTVPIDEKDGAARCLDPIFSGVLTSKNEYGKFFKDYKKELW